jgi:NodT family efflux transporter outer membrane factor (OMF) lipoprotein
VPKNIAGHWNSIDEGSLGLSYELDFWGKNRAAVNAALDRSHAVEVDLQAARLALTTAVVRSYLRLDAAFAQRDLAEATLHEREETLALVQKRVAASLDSQLELTQAESALPAAREQIAVIDEAIALIRNQLAALEGQGPDAARSLNRPKLATATPVQIPAALPVELLGRRPDVVAARWRVEAASEDITVATAQFYPNVTLNAFVGLQSLGLSDFLSPGSRVMGIGPAFSLPVFDGGRLRSNLRRNQADYDAAVATYNGTLVDALHDVVDQLVSLDAVKQQQVEQNEALRLSQKAFDLATSRYRSGLASYLQVLSAEAQVLIQQRAVIATEARQRELQLNLVRALGGGFQPASVS